MLIGDIAVTAGERVTTGIGELDRVLGGGVVPGSLVLIGGDPGIGKSTLLLQASRSLADLAALSSTSRARSRRPVKLRADRLGIAPRGLYFLAETDLQVIEAHAAELKPRALVVDSIQTVFLPGLESAPGSVSQVRECAARSCSSRRARDCTFLVGHVTKDGAIAGPRLLEHLVDTVLYFEGSSTILTSPAGGEEPLRSTNEIGVFEMASRDWRRCRIRPDFFSPERPRGAGARSSCPVSRENPRVFRAAAGSTGQPSSAAAAQPCRGRRDQRLKPRRAGRVACLETGHDDRARGAPRTLGEKNPDGFGTSASPCSPISNTPISLVDPKRFFTARRRR